MKYWLVKIGHIKLSKVGGKVDTTISILIAILIFGFIVIIHELGHYFFAKKNGIYVEEFAIGMGPKIISRKKGETVYSIRALPFGGFCKMLGEDEVVDDQRAFSSKSVWAKIQVVFGGPLFNFLLAFVFAVILILISGAVTTTIDQVVEDSPAQQAGLQAGDRITEINGRSITAYKEIIIYINENKGEAVEVTYKRDGVKDTVKIIPEYSTQDQTYKIGFVPKLINKSNIFQVVKYSILEIIFWIKMVYYSLGMIFSGGVSANDIAGPVGIVNVVSEGYRESIKIGLINVVNTIAFFIVLLSSNLGVMNLLPIPALDGGRLVFLAVEAIRGKPIDQEKEGYIHFVGYVLLMLLMVLILFNDIRKLF